MMKSCFTRNFLTDIILVSKGKECTLMTKRITALFAVLLVCSLMLTLFAGCSTKETSAEVSAETETPAAETAQVPEEPDADPGAEAAVETSEPETEAELEKEFHNLSFPLDESVQLTAWTMWVPGINAYIEKGSECAHYAKFQELTNVDMEFQWVASPDTATTEFNLMVAAETYPDLINNFAQYYTNGIDDGIEQEIILDHLPLIEEYMPHYWNYLYGEEFAQYEIIDEVLTTKGQIGAINNIYDPTMENLSTFSGLITRADWLEELNLDTPETFDDIHNMLLKMKDAYNLSNVLFVPRNGLPGSLFNAYGFSVDFNLEMGSAPWNIVHDEAGDTYSYSFSFVEPEFKEILSTLHTWYTEGIFNTDFISNTYNFEQDQMVSGTYGLYSYGLDGVDTPVKQGIDVVAIPSPVFNAGDKISTAKQKNTYTISQGYSITTNCEAVDVAASWLDFMYTDEAYIINNYGVEGVSFEYDDNGKPCFTEIITNNPDGIQPVFSRFMNVTMTGSYVADINRFMTGYCDQALEAPDIWQSNLDYYTAPDITVELTMDERTNLASYFSDVSTYLNSMICKYIVGEESLDGFDDFVETCYSTGLTQCFEIQNGALARAVEAME